MREAWRNNGRELLAEPDRSGSLGRGVVDRIQVQQRMNTAAPENGRAREAAGG